MRSLRAVLLATLLVATSTLPALAAGTQRGAATSGSTPSPAKDPTARPAGSPKPGDVVPGRFLVRFERAATKAERAAARGALGPAIATGTGEGHGRGHALTLVPDLELVEADLTLAQAKARLKGKAGVRTIEPDRYIAISALPNDPYFPDSWGLRETGDHDIDAPEAWTITRGQGVTVAVLDTGVDLDHEDLAANIWTNDDEIAGNGLDDDDNGYVDDIEGWDYVDDDADPNDEHWHGTHVAGTIAAVRDNATGSVGVAPEARIMALRVLDENGVGTIGESVAAIDYAVRNGARVLNLSWTWYGYVVQPVVDVLTAAGAAGVVVAAAAGNDGLDIDGEPMYPAAFDVPGLISVGAIDDGDALGSFSNRGRATVDLTAPGVDVLATVPGDGYAYASGTSMAAPHVAGVAALVIQQHPDWSAAKVRSRIIATARPVAGLAGTVASGGTLDAAAALVGAVDKPPTVAITAPKAPAEALPETTVTFTATATDPEDGNVAASIVWRSSLQGSLGTGASIQRGDLVTGEHIITAMAADAGGHRPIASLLLRIGPKRTTIDRTPDDWGAVIAVTPAGIPTIAFSRTERGTYVATRSGSAWTRTLVGPSDGDYWPSIDLTASGQPRVAAMRDWSGKLILADPGIMLYRPGGGAWTADRASFTCVGGDEGCGRDWTPSMAIDGDDREHIATVRTGLTFSNGSLDPVGGLVYLRRLENGGWATEHLDGSEDIGTVDLALAPDGAVHIVYTRVGPAAPGVWHVTNETGSWVRRRLSTSTTQVWPRVAVDATGRVRVATASLSGVSLRTRTGTTWNGWTVIRPGPAGNVDLAIDGTTKVHLVVGLIDAQSTATGVAYVTQAGAGWSTTTIQPGQGVDPRLAVDAAGKVHVAYRFVSPTDFGIRYATNASGSWTRVTVSPGRSSNGPGYAIDGRGIAHAVTSSWGSGAGTFYGTDEGGAWQLTKIASGIATAGGHPSVAVTSTGEAHVAFSIGASADGTDVPDAVWYATNVSGTWASKKIGNLRGAGSPQLRLDAAGKVHIVFAGEDANGPGLFYATDASGTMVVKRLASGDNEYPSLVLDANGNRHIATVRVNQTTPQTRDLRYFTDAGGSWSSGTIASSTASLDPAIAIDPQGDPAVAYHVWDDALYLTQRKSGSWSTRIVDDDPYAMFPDLVVDADGTRRVVYSRSLNDYTRCPGQPLGCADYPGLKQATAGPTGGFDVETLGVSAYDLFADVDRGRDGSLGVAFSDGAGISELRLSRTKKAATTLTYQGPSSGRKGTSVTLKAKLTAGATPLAGRTVTFKLDGVVLGSATTDAQGVATRVVTLAATVGSHRLTAGFSGASTHLASRAGPLGFTVQP